MNRGKTIKNLAAAKPVSEERAIGISESAVWDTLFNQDYKQLKKRYIPGMTNGHGLITGAPAPRVAP